MIEVTEATIELIVLADEHWCPPPLSGEGVSLTNEGSRALG
jgi:hypothetical protein